MVLILLLLLAWATPLWADTFCPPNTVPVGTGPTTDPNCVPVPDNAIQDDYAGIGACPAGQAVTALNRDSAPVCSAAGTNASSIVTGILAAARGGTGNGLQYVVNDRGATTTPACDWSLGYICRFAAGSASTLTVSNVPGSATNPVSVELDIYASALLNITLPSTMWTVGADAVTNNSGTFSGSNTIQAPGPTSGNAFSAFYWKCDGTNCYYNGGQSIRTRSITSQFVLTASLAEANNTFLNDNATVSMARMPLTFSTSSTTTATNFGVYKTVKAITIENVECLDAVATSCTGGSVVRLYDCGTSAPTNANCSGGTQLTTCTTSTTAGATVDGTVNSAGVAASHYIGEQIQALGANCTAVGIAVTAMARPQ